MERAYVQRILSGKFPSRKWISKEITKICEKSYKKGKVCFKPTEIFEFLADHREELLYALTLFREAKNLVDGVGVVWMERIRDPISFHYLEAGYGDYFNYLWNRLLEFSEHDRKLEEFLEIVKKTSGEAFMMFWRDKQSFYLFLDLLNNLPKMFETIIPCLGVAILLIEKVLS